MPEFLRTLVFARPRGDDQFADCTFSPSLDMSMNQDSESGKAGQARPDDVASTHRNKTHILSFNPNDIKINLSKEKTLIEAKRQTLLTKNKRYLSLIDKENIDEYEQLSDNLMQLRQRIGKCEEIIDTLVRYENNLTSLQENIESYSTGGSERKNGNEIYQIRMDSFNKYFTPLAQKINEENPILVYSPDTHKFPVSFSALSGSSTGTRKSLIAAYDLAYQQFAIANQIQSPHFIVHDVVENVEGDDLRTIINIANGIDAQYIVAVLKEKLDSSHISKAEQEKLTILQLSEDDKLFEGKTVNDRENSKGNILSLPFEF
ncbi:DUF2326 domain-containing protein [Bifidobacterium longum]|nr:DUF2326 domain-containing protein [Bifidobacterium longum]